MTFKGWKITGAVFFGVAALCAAVIALSGFNEASVRLLVRDTARVSFCLFILAFTASSLNTLFRRPWTSYLLRNRRYIGVSFALSHGVHFLCLVALYVWFPHPFREYLDVTTLIGGGLAYVFIALMALTSFDWSAALIGRRAWTVLHTVGSYYICILFAQSYIPRAFADVWYAPFAVVAVAALALRIYAAVYRRRARLVAHPANA